LGDLCPRYLAGATAQETLLDGRDHDRMAVNAPAGDDGAVVGLRCNALRLEPRGFQPVERPGEHPRRSGVQQCRRAAKRVEFDEAATREKFLPGLADK
jgi:hypothetical protein